MSRTKSNKPIRDTTITIKFLSKQKKEIQKKAKSLNIDVSEYIRDLIEKDLRLDK